MQTPPTDFAMFQSFKDPIVCVTFTIPTKNSPGVEKLSSVILSVYLLTTEL